jgi:hypothetical protein
VNAARTRDGEYTRWISATTRDDGDDDEKYAHGALGIGGHSERAPRVRWRRRGARRRRRRWGDDEKKIRNVLIAFGDGARARARWETTFLDWGEREGRAFAPGGGTLRVQRVL